MESSVNLPRSVRFSLVMHNAFSAWLILVLSILLTVGAYFLTDHFVKKRAEDLFNFRAREVQEAITYRLYLYEQVLWSGAALMNASSEVSRDDFRRFVDTLHLEQRWPGIQGIGYSMVVPAGQKQAHIDSIRAEGFPHYTIMPDGDRSLYTAIIYLEPFDWRNQRAFGYDMYSNDVRRAAMERARDTGIAATSGLITLVQETKDDLQRGFLIYVPVYKGKDPPQTVEERRARIRGWVYAPFRAGNLMKGILGLSEDRLQFDLYDGLQTRPEDLLYSSAGRLPDQESDYHPQFHKRVQLDLQGRPWVLDMQSPPNFLSSEDQSQPRYVAIAGIIVDLLLFYVIFSLKYINRQVETIAGAKTRELEKAKQNLEAEISARTAELRATHDDLEQTVQQRTQMLQEKLRELETLNRVTLGREERILALKAEVNDLSQRLGRKPPYESIQ